MDYYFLTDKTVFEGRTVVEVYGHHLHWLPVSPAKWVGHTVDTCHDVERWTNEMGRIWWQSRGRTAAAQLRHQREAREQRFQPTAAVAELFVIRRAKAPRRS